MDTSAPPPKEVFDASAAGATTTALALRWREHRDLAAREQLFHRFLPLAVKLARRYTNSHEPVEDLVQVASVGLLGAIDRFDPHRGVAFSSFAVPTILGELKRHFRKTGWSVHVPRGAQEMALRVDRAAKALTAQSGSQPGIAQLAEHLQVTVEEVLIGLDAGNAHYSVSLDAPIAQAAGELDTLGESIGREDENYQLVETASSLSAAIAHLPYFERRALALRLENDMTQTAIAQQLGCSQMQVSRLLRRAMDRLRALAEPDSAMSRGS